MLLVHHHRRGLTSYSAASAFTTTRARQNAARAQAREMRRPSPKTMRRRLPLCITLSEHIDVNQANLSGAELGAVRTARRRAL